MVVSQGKVYESFADVGGEARGSLQREMVGQRAKSKLPKHLPLILAAPRVVRVALSSYSSVSLYLADENVAEHSKGLPFLGERFKVPGHVVRP